MAKLKFNEEALKYGPWSVSALDVASTCTYRFKLQYIDRVKPPLSSDPRFAIDPKGKVGNAVHIFLELLLKGVDSKTAWVKSIVDAKLTTPETETALEYKQNCFNFVDRLKKFSQKHPVKQSQVEIKFGFTKDLKPTKFFGKDVFFRGVVDLALFMEAPRAIIMDHKTGQPSEDKEGNKVALKPAQLNTYAIASEVLYSKHCRKNLEFAQTATHYVSTGDIVWEEPIPRTTIVDTLIPWFVGYVNECASNVKNIEAKKTWLCDFCKYKQLCPIFNPEAKYGEEENTKEEEI